MGTIISLIILLIGFILHSKRKCWYAPDVLFCYQWALISFMSSMHLYTMYESSDKVYFIILIGTISYFLGVNYSYKIKIISSPIVGPDTQDFISKKLFWIFTILLFLLKFKPFMQSLALQMAGMDLQDIRHEFFASSQSPLQVLINVAVSLFGPLVEIAGIVYFVRDVKKNYVYFIAVLVYALMESVINGGRFGIAFLIIELFVCYSILKTRVRFARTNFKKYSKTIKFYIIFMAAIIVAITFLRGAETDELLSKYYRYLCGNVVFFDLHIPLIEERGCWYLLGTGFWGFWFLFFPLLHALIGFPYPSWYLDATNNVMNTQDFMQIGDDMYTNAFSTPFYYLYADARWIGVILGMILFGVFAGIVYRKMLINTTNKHYIIYILVCQMIFMTIYFYPFTNTGYMVIVLYLLGLKILKK